MYVKSSIYYVFALRTRVTQLFMSLPFHMHLSSCCQPSAVLLRLPTSERKDQVQRRATLKTVLRCCLVVRPASNTHVSKITPYPPFLFLQSLHIPFSGPSQAQDIRTSVSHHKSTSAVQVGYPPSPQRAPLSLRPVSCQLVALSKPFHLSDARIGGVHDRRVREVVEMRLRD